MNHVSTTQSVSGLHSHARAWEREKRNLVVITQILLFAISLLVVTGRTEAQEVDSLPPRIPNALYLDIATIALAGNASINYELPIKQSTLLRIGYGFGYLVGFDRGDATTSGLLVMANFLTSGGNNRFEIGAGGSVVAIDNYKSKSWTTVLPAFAIGYRYHPYSGGIVFRMGLCYTYVVGAPLYLSIGTTL